MARLVTIRTYRRGSLVEQVKHASRPSSCGGRGMRLQGCETRVSPSVQVLCVRRGIRGQQQKSHRYREYGGVDGFDGGFNQSATYRMVADKARSQ
jgi:hypothetical protein